MKTAEKIAHSPVIEKIDEFKQRRFAKKMFDQIFLKDTSFTSAKIEPNYIILINV